mgnify:CR=1 FL=1
MPRVDPSAGVTTAASSTSRGSVGVVALLTVLVELLIPGYGVLLLPLSGLGGAWIVAIELSLLFAGLFVSEWVRDRMGRPAAAGRRLSLAFATLAVLLLVASVVDGMTFQPGEASGARPTNGLFSRPVVPCLPTCSPAWTTAGPTGRR